MSESAQAQSAPVESSSEPIIESSSPELEAAPTQEEVSELWETLKLKINGEEVEEKINLKDKDYLTKQFQLARAGQKAMQERSEYEKVARQRESQLEQLINVLKENPASVLEELGYNVEELAEEVLREKVERMKRDPKELEIEELQSKLQEAIKREEQIKKAQEEKERELLQDKYAQEYQKDLIEAIDSSGLRNNPAIVSRAIQYMSIALKNEVNLSFKDIMPIVKSEIESDIEALLGKMPDEVVEKILKSDRIDSLYKKRREKLKPKEEKKVPPPSMSGILDSGIQSQEVRKKIPVKDFFKNL